MWYRMKSRLLCLLALSASTIAFADGTEQLGTPSIAIASGSGFAIGGAGLFEQPSEGVYNDLTGNIHVAVPAGAVVKQVLLYWNSEHYPQSGGDGTALVNGTPVTGTPIGGPTNFFSVVYFQAYRADITSLGLVGPGENVIEVADIDSSFRSTGAGVLVIYDDGTPSDLQLVDGLDLTYWRFEPPLGEAIPVTFAFEPADVARTAQIPMFVGSAEANRPNLTEVTVGGETHQYYNLYASLDGSEWDSQLLEVEVPAGASDLTVNILSASDGTNNNPASMAWLAAGFSIALPQEPEPECGPCKGGLYELTLQYTGAVPNAKVKIVQQSLLHGVHNAFTGTLNPGDTFTFTGDPDKGDLGNLLYVFINNRYHFVQKSTCKADLRPGDHIGNFKVAGGVSTQGGFLCPREPENPDTDETCEDGKPKALTFQYLADSCDNSDHSQPEPLFYCAGDSTGVDPAYVVVSDNVDPLSPYARLYYHGTVRPGESFTVDAANAGLSRLRAAIFVFILDADFQPKQCIMIHTSCFVPLEVGDQYGGLLLTGFDAYESDHDSNIAKPRTTRAWRNQFTDGVYPE